MKTKALAQKIYSFTKEPISGTPEEMDREGIAEIEDLIKGALTAERAACVQVIEDRIAQLMEKGYFYDDLKELADKINGGCHEVL